MTHPSTPPLIQVQEDHWRHTQRPDETRAPSSLDTQRLDDLRHTVLEDTPQHHLESQNNYHVTEETPSARSVPQTQSRDVTAANEKTVYNAYSPNENNDNVNGYFGSNAEGDIHNRMSPENNISKNRNYSNVSPEYNHQDKAIGSDTEKRSNHTQNDI